MPEDTIFVQIASYRDPELQWTLKDLFEKAKRPENIFVGICHQYDMKGDEDKHLFEIPFSYPKQLRIDEVDYRDSQGCCWARNRVQKLWKGEKWTLMIDSHMRFEKDWDEILVKNYKNNLDFNSIISSYPPGFDYDLNDNIIYNYWLCRMRPTFKNSPDNGQIINFGQPPNIVRYEKINKLINCSIGCGFIFSCSSILNINYDRYLYFMGEEISLAVRFWTNGYNIYCPNFTSVFHLYNTERSKSGCFQDPNKNKKDNPNKDKKDYISFSRVKHLLNTKKTNDPEVLENIKEYGLGDKRTLRDYERFSGVDFRRKITREHTKQGIFEEWQEVAKISDVKNVFNNR